MDINIPTIVLIQNNNISIADIFHWAYSDYD